LDFHRFDPGCDHFGHPTAGAALLRFRMRQLRDDALLRKTS
jgi:hypothetical protein